MYSIDCFIQRPDEYTQAAPPPWPTIIFLHGKGERGQDLELVKKHGIPRFRVARDRRPFDSYFPFYVVAPQCPDNRTWHEAPILETLDTILDELDADPLVDNTRLYLTGWSLGGSGAWTLALRHWERFSAIAIVSGRCLEYRRNPGPVVERIRHLPIWIAYSVNDTVVDPIFSIEMIKALNPSGLVRTRLFNEPNAEEGEAHVMACENAYSDPELYTWFLTQQRIPKKLF